MEKKVTIYSTSVCMYCAMAKDFLKKNNINYTEHDVANDEAMRKEMFEKSHQMGVPVIDIDGEIFVGFNRKILSEALGIGG